MTILFDLDNTLIDRNAGYECWLRAIFVENDIITSPIEWQAIVATDHWGYTSREEFYNWLLSVYPLPYTNEALIAKGANEIYEYIPAVDSEVEVVLKELKNRYQIGIVTNGGIKNQMNKLKGSTLLSLFEKEAIFISEAVGFSKPDKLYFSKVERRLQKPTHEIIIVGDDPINDIEGGRQAGWKTVWISKGRDKEVTADYVLNSLTDLTTIF